MAMPHDLITEILCRLDVEDLLRYRCLSKGCCSLIDSPDFIKHHLSHSLKTGTHLSLILRNSELYSVDFDSLETAKKLKHPLDEDDEGNGTEVLGSCNGLLALLGDYGGEKVALWNPSTRKSQMLPVSEIEFPPYNFACCQFITYGLGYDPNSDDYKFVRIVQFYGQSDDSFDSEVKVYSLKTNSWRRIKDFPFYLKYKRAYGILASNALHWVVSKKPESDTKSFIVAFDLATEEYRVVDLPDSLDEGFAFHMNVKALRDCLCMIANDVVVHVVDIWVMKEYGVKESWSKLVTVKQPETISSFDFVLPLAYSKRGDQVLLNQDEKVFVWYDLEKKRVIKRVRRIQGAPSSFEVEMLVASLVPLQGSVSKEKQDGEIKKKKTKKQDGQIKKKMNKKKEDDFLSQGFRLVL